MTLEAQRTLLPEQGSHTSSTRRYDFWENFGHQASELCIRGCADDYEAVRSAHAVLLDSTSGLFPDAAQISKHFDTVEEIKIARGASTLAGLVIAAEVYGMSLHSYPDLQFNSRNYLLKSGLIQDGEYHKVVNITEVTSNLTGHKGPEGPLRPDQHGQYSQAIKRYCEGSIQTLLPRHREVFEVIHRGVFAGVLLMDTGDNAGLGRVEELLEPIKRQQK